MKATYQLIFNRKDKLNSQGQAPVEIRVTLNRKTAYFSTKIHIKPTEWNDKRLRVNSKHPNNIKINNYLYDKISEIEEYELNERDKGKKITIDDIRRFIRSNNGNKDSFPEWCLRILEENQTIDKATKIKRRVLVNRLLKFNKNLQFSQIDYMFMREFDNFLHTEKTPHGKPLKQVTIHGQMKILRYFLNLAFKMQKISFVPDYKVKKGESIKEALSESELRAIENLSFPDNPMLKKTKDLFLFSSYTALRFGDITKLTKDNIRETEDGKELFLIMEKVDKPVTIPLYKLFDGKPEKIFNKYLENGDNTIFEVPANQTINRNLKIIKGLAGIQKPLSFHISRHTCLTLIGKKTGNPYLVMKIAGHSDIKTSMKYTQGVIDDELFNLL